MGGLLIACALDFAFCGAVLLAGIGFGGPWFWVAVAYVLYRTLAGFMHGLQAAHAAQQPEPTPEALQAAWQAGYAYAVEEHEDEDA